MDLHTFLEIISVIFGILYLVLMVRENIWCWIFGILSSVITVYLYTHVTLYLEAGLNVYYILAGFYGWHYWLNHQTQDTGVTPVVDWKINLHLITLIGCGSLGLVLGYVMDTYTDSERPYIDALITVFSFVATYMEAKKVLSTWYYWFFLNGLSIALQIDRELYFFSALSVFYTVMSIYGYRRWKKTMRSQSPIAKAD